MEKEVLKFGIPLRESQFPELDGENLDWSIQKSIDSILVNTGFIDEQGNQKRSFHIKYKIERDEEGKRYMGRIFDGKTENKRIRRLKDNLPRIISDFCAFSDYIREGGDLFGDQVITPSNFRHMFHNLNISPRMAYQKGLEETMKDKEFRESVFKDLKSAKVYMELLMNYPEYRAAEITSVEGYFPEIVKVGNANHNYIQESKRLLEEKAKNQSKDL